MDALTVNYEGQPCYKIVFEPDFSRLLSVFNQELNKSYDKICIVSDSNVAPLYLAEVIDIFKETSSQVCSFS